MPRSLSLHHLCAMEVDAETLVDIAAGAGFQHVCLFTETPAGMGLAVPLVTEDRRKSLRARMDDQGISALNIEVMVLARETRVADFRRALELGAGLGARSCTVIVSDEDESRTIDNFAEICALAAEYGILPGIEFMAFSPVKTLDDAARILSRAGHPNGGLTLDLLHFIRNGVSPDAIRAIPRAEIGYVQLCDGASLAPADAWDEAIANRTIPGEGDFPVAAFLAAVPKDQAIALEVPLERLRMAGVAAPERARRLAAAARHCLAGN